ncbi:hypothetical protein FRAHR75_80017 [Frankia sp. Hr75.2]|nr:hypothetical protein FRAHR75_80017 [Frankia sp. Hr75.2]SQD99112.1 hypothetical protein FMEAI12_5110028 [Parafrankia sp. Ea1.12]
MSGWEIDPYTDQKVTATIRPAREAWLSAPAFCRRKSIPDLVGLDFLRQPRDAGTVRPRRLPEGRVKGPPG